MKKIIYVLVIIILSMCCFGCNGKKSKVLEQIDINSFELQTEFDSFFIGNSFGKVLPNENNEFVKNGIKSAQLNVTGSVNSKNPFLYQTLDLQYKQDYTDFTYSVLLTFWIYNDNDEDKSCSVLLSFDEGSLGKQEFIIVKKQWTQVKYLIKRENLPQNKCNGFYLYFEKNLVNPDIFYIDNIVLYKTDKKIEKQEIILSENEICSFDKIYQHSLLNVAIGDSESDLYPNLTISQEHTYLDEDFNLKISAPKGQYTWQGGSSNWPGFEINTTLISLVDWSKYNNDDEFCFDYYDPEDNGLDYLWISFYDDWEQRFYVSNALTLKKGKWQTFKLKVSDINKDVEFSDQFGFKRTSRIVLRWGEFNDYDRVIYVDNFRMETNSN